MSKKAGIGIGIGVVVVILLAWIGVTVSGVMSESNTADSFLKDAVANHMAQADVSQKLKDMGFEMTDTAGASSGLGPVHSLLVYSTRLTVKLTYDAAGKANSYHLDKS